MDMRGSMRIVFLAPGLLLVTPGQGAVAQHTRILGVGRLFGKDLLGDGHDRWRTGSNSLCVLTGQGWDGSLAG